MCKQLRQHGEQAVQILPRVRVEEKPSHTNKDEALTSIVSEDEALATLASENETHATPITGGRCSNWTCASRKY